MPSQIFENELTDCPLCGSSRYIPWLTLTDRGTNLSGEFPLVRCRECGFAYLNPRPSIQSIGRYYPETYAPHEVPVKHSGLSRWIRNYGLRKRCRVLLRIQQRGKVLDVGCGFGQFMAAMHQHGWEPAGVDLSERAVTYVIKALGLPAYHGQLEDLALPESSFDAVTMWDSLEHMHHPRDVLREAWRVLKPGGHLLIRVPSLDSLDAHIFKTNWAGFDAPRHLVSFSRQTLVRIIIDAGFTPERVWCMSGSYASFVISCQFALNSPQKPAASGGGRLKAVDNMLVQLLSSPYFFLADQINRGPEITLLASKASTFLPEVSLAGYSGLL